MKDDKRDIIVIFDDNKIGNTYRKRAKGLLKKNRALLIADNTLLIKQYKQDYTIKEKGHLPSGKHDPKGLMYPAIIASLKVFMRKDFDCRIHNVSSGKILGRNDNVYTRQIGLSLEGFTLMYGMSNFMLNKESEFKPLFNSLDYEGFDYEILDKRDNIKDILVDNISKDYPIIAFCRNKEIWLICGYKNFGEALIKAREPRIVKFHKDTNEINDWEGNIAFLVVCKGFKENEVDKKNIIIETLENAVKMIKSDIEFYDQYGYGNNI